MCFVGVWWGLGLGGPPIFWWRATRASILTSMVARESLPPFTCQRPDERATICRHAGGIPPSPIKHLVSARSLINESVLAALQAHPLFAAVTLVGHVDGRASLLTAAGRSRTDGGAVAYIYNPSMLDDDTMLLKVSRFSWCTANGTANSSLAHASRQAHSEQTAALHSPWRMSVWLQHGRVRGVIPNSEDARAVRLGGKVFAVFTRTGGAAESHRKQPWLAALEPEYDEVPLSFPGSTKRDETNWTPFSVDGETLLLSYTLCPHRVLECSPSSGRCALRWESTPESGCPRLSHGEMRGGSQMVHLPTRKLLVGAAHFKQRQASLGRASKYFHVLFAFHATPPYELRGLSTPFELPAPQISPFARHIQFVAGAALSASLPAHLQLSFGIADCAALAVALPLSAVLETTRWLPQQVNRPATRRNVSSHPPMPSPPMPPPPPPPPPALARNKSASALGGRPRTLAHAVIVTGPLHPFTRSALAHYLATFVGVGVAFSHSTATKCAGAPRALLDGFATAYPHTFAYTLPEPPPRPGWGRRNAQRESASAGIALAIHTWDSRFLLVHGPDGAFQNPTTLPMLGRLLGRFTPPPTVGGNQWGRLAFCPFNTLLSDAHGRFHLDAHTCIFGRREPLSRFWQTDAHPMYNRSAATSIASRDPHTPAATEGARTRCPAVAVESELGELWVGWAARLHGVPVPPSTHALLHQRGLLLNPRAFGFVHVPPHTPLPHPTLPWPEDIPVIMPRASLLSAVHLCTARGDTYDCTHAPDATNESFGTRAPSCEEPEASRCDGGSQAEAAAGDHGESQGAAPRTIIHAIVIKGPLLPFTRLVLRYYLERLFVGRARAGVVFSHNNASACDDARRFLNALQQAHPETFAHVLAPPPPRQGIGYRNSQREAAAHGIALAARRWRDLEYIMVHRPDAAFQDDRTLTSLASVLQRSPPLLAPAGPTWGRLGFCPFQTQLIDAYGKYHLDDHCVFGRVEPMARFWSLDNPLYRRELPASTELPDGARPPSGGCAVPGPESENGQLWVGWAAREGVAAPSSTLALLAERAFVINPSAYEYVALRNHPARRTESLRLPLDVHLFGNFRTSSQSTPLRLCMRRAHTFDCSSLALNASFEGRELPAWPCPDPDVLVPGRGAGSKWEGLCSVGSTA